MSPAKANARTRLGRQLAEMLKETNPEAMKQIERVIQTFGKETALQLAAEAQNVFSGDGMLTQDGTRKRSVGGIFFALAHQRASKEEWLQIRPRVPQQQGNRPKAGGGVRPPMLGQLTFPRFNDILAVAYSREAGALMNARITLSGRPAELLRQRTGEYIAFTLQSGSMPSLPKGLPAPVTTRYLVLVATKQWNRVKEALLADPTDHLAIEGVTVYYPEFKGVSVLATRCESVGLLRRKREAEAAATTEKPAS